VRIGYLTVDEVNQTLAGQMVAACGLELEVLTFREEFAPEHLEALLYDLDFLAQPERRQLFGRLLAAPVRRPMAVHSRNLNVCQVRALREQGIAVFRRLEAPVFRRFRRAVRKHRHLNQRLLSLFD
jgi:hypothetical protein